MMKIRGSVNFVRYTMYLKFHASIQKKFARALFGFGLSFLSPFCLSICHFLMRSTYILVMNVSAIKLLHGLLMEKTAHIYMFLS